MEKILSQDEIDTLLSNVPDDSDDDAGDRSVIPYNFRQPAQVSRDQRRLLETIHEDFCRSFGLFLSSQLKVFVEVNLLSLEQIAYTDFVVSIASPGCVYVLEVDDPSTQIFLDIAPQFVVFVVERFLGGRGSFNDQVRPITIIEQKIFQRLVDRITVEISKNWRQFSSLNCSVSGFESNPELLQNLSSSQSVLVASFEVKIQGDSTLMNICYPYSWILSMLEKPRTQAKILFDSREANEEERRIVTGHLFQTQVCLRVILGKARISIGDFISLREKDVIRLGSTIGSLKPVYINNIHLFNTSIGVKKQKYAIRIDSILEGNLSHEL